MLEQEGAFLCASGYISGSLEVFGAQWKTLTAMLALTPVTPALPAPCP